MAARHHVLRADDGEYAVPDHYAAHSRGYRRRVVVDGTAGSVHQGFGMCELGPDGEVGWHVHSYEEGFYVTEGEVVLETQEGATLLREGDYGIVSVGAAHSWRSTGSSRARWADMLAPQPRDDASTDTWFVTAPRSDGSAPRPVDPRDPRTRSFGHIDPHNMEPGKQTQDLLALSASMRTALLVYSGISVKMMIDSDLGAHLLTMFMVQYEPGGVAGAHDHPLEETYLILEGEVDAVFDGEKYRLAAGDIAFAGVGCPHEFSNPADVPVRWLETQAPQPPSRHSYRFDRDWDYLTQVLGRGDG
jgi:quercetin dioxygenase-like cupin family protein